MGAETFYEEEYADTSLDAWVAAKKQALQYYGSRPYTGSIKEKSSYTMASNQLLDIDAAYDLANKLIDTVYSDKWGPAGCIEVIPAPGLESQRRFLFFGWASS